MADITIPPEALEAAARAHAKMNEGHDEWWVLHVDKVRAACLALIQSWPNANWDEAHTIGIILPLTENQNDKA